MVLYNDNNTTSQERVSANGILSEHTSLIQSSSPNKPHRDDISSMGNASMFQTIVNMAKTCMGTGCLVLPFAAKQGGLLLHTVGLLAIGAWNVYTMQRLCQCLDYLPQQPETKETKLQKGLIQTSNNDDPNNLQYTDSADSRHQHHPPEGTATFGKVVWYALGRKGLVTLDLLMLLFLMGVLVTYVNAMRSFLRDTPITSGSDIVDAFLLVAIMGPLSIVPHMGYLAYASAIGLLVLAFTFVIIAGYGLEQLTATETVHWTSQSSSAWWLPQNGLWGISHWFGCVVFSFGVAPLTYNFRSSLADPKQMIPAAWIALMGVAITYMGLGIGFLVLFPTLESDLLHELPTNGILPIVTRLAMVVVVLMTAPLLIVPCGELLEGKVQMRSITIPLHHMRIMFRFGICILCVAISLYVPGFVDVLSFVGCCCVAVVGFCIPPFIHGLLCYQNRTQKPIRPVTMTVDVLMLSWGIFATIVSTTYTFRQISVASTRSDNIDTTGR